MELLLLHGFRGNHLGLKDVARCLRKTGFKVTAPDLPPMTRYPLDKYDAESYAKWVANYILEKKLDRPVLIGHSMGSVIAAATAEKYPELINEKVVFLAPISVKPPKFLLPLAPLVAILPSRFVGYITTKYLIVKKDKAFLRDTLDLTYKCAKNYSSRIDLMKAALFSEKHAISDFSFDRDTLFLAGEKDRLNSKTATKSVAKKYRGTAKFLENTGHLLNYEVPDLAAAEISAFLNPPLD